MHNLCIDGAAKTLDFYKRAFSAVETWGAICQLTRSGRAEIMIGDSPIMFGDTDDGLGRARQSS
jgi:uncharacterized glyoxalase superfamily protein PhnB